MKIESIQISVFGRFSQVQFGPFSDHAVVIHGPHEAGKSTLHAFIRTMLFGFPQTGLRAVQHVTASGRYGGRLVVRDAEQRAYIVERYLEAHGSAARVTTPEGGSAGQALLDELLAHISPDLYHALFTFGAEELYSIGSMPEEAASGRMYAAGLGVERLPEILDSFQRQALEVFDPAGRDEPVARLLRALDAVEQSLARTRDAAETHHALWRRREEISLDIRAVDVQIAAISRVEGRILDEERRSARARARRTHGDRAAASAGAEAGSVSAEADGLRREIDELRESWTRLQAMRRMHDVYQATVARQRIPRSPWFLALLMVGVMLPLVLGAVTAHRVVLTLGIASAALGMVLLVLAAIARSRFEAAQLQALLHLEMTHREAQGRFLHAAMETHIDPEHVEAELLRLEQLQAALAASSEQSEAHGRAEGAGDAADQEERVLRAGALAAAQEEWRTLARELPVPEELAGSPAAARAALEARRDELLIGRGRLDEQIQRLESDRRDAALRFEREALLTLLGERVRIWATHVVAGTLARDAVHAYGASRQPEVMAFASDAFDAMTLGAFHQLSAQADGNGIVALGRDGQALGVAGMSRGMRAQAYLALRIGLIRACGRRALPLPVLVDDILVNFDPERAVEAMRALARLTPEHQVFIFTSHPSTVALARFVMPGASFIALGEQSMSGFAPIWLDNT